jgi:beta-1,4-N-acetylglucosaminyltransferase
LFFVPPFTSIEYVFDFRSRGLITLSVALQFLGLPSPKLIYIESFARVRSLSLSGKLLQRLVDRSVSSCLIYANI